MKSINVALVLIVIANLVSGFTLRTKCSSNQLTFTKRFIAFYINLLETNLPIDTINYYQYLNSYIAYHFGYPYKYIPSNDSTKNFCNNFFISENNCCSVDDINQLKNAFLHQYSFLYANNNTKYPSFMLLYELQIKLSQANCGVMFQLPGVNDYNYSNASQFGELVRQHDDIMQKIRSIQRQYLTDSVCILCTGPQSYKHFLYPDESDRRKQQYRKFVINKNYFQEITKKVAGLLQQFGTIHDNMVSKILAIGNSLNQTVCSSIKIQFTNITRWNNLKICSSNDLQKCLQFAVDYFGDAGAPQYSRMFSIKYQNGLLPNRGNISLSNQNGYRGNLDYGNYAGDVKGKSVIEYTNYTDIVKMFV